MLRERGLEKPEQLYDEPTLESGRTALPRRRIGLQELLLEAASANGYTGRNVP
jgi:hypothetical protein